MNNLFMGVEESRELKALGFDESCFAIYDKGMLKLLGGIQRRNSTYPDVITAPLIQQVFTWFRETHGFYAEILVDRTMEPKFCYNIFRYVDNNWEDLTDRKEFFLEYTYESAEYNCLQKLIGIVKNK